MDTVLALMSQTNDDEEENRAEIIKTLRDVDVGDVVRVEFGDESASTVEIGIELVEDYPGGNIEAFTDPEHLQMVMDGYTRGGSIRITSKQEGWRQPVMDVMLEDDDGERSWHVLDVVGVEIVDDRE